MSRRTLGQPDSLEMLLDTMCNTFGGIILIALLIALLARETNVKDAATRVVTDSETMLQQRIALAEQDLREARARQAVLEQQARDHAQAGLFQLIEQREQLRQLSAGLTERLRDSQSQLDAGPSADTSHVEEAIRQMLERVSNTEQRQIEARNLQASLQTKQRELRRTLQQDSNRLAQALAPRVQRLRLPREHETDKKHLYIVVRHGRLYPLYVYRNDNPERNTHSLRWIEESPTIRRVEPLPTLGAPVTTENALATFFRQYPVDHVYLVFQVYEDSFAAFNTAKTAAVALGFDYTWQPRRNSEILRIGAGSAPPPPQ